MELPKRKCTRLKDYDYNTPGYYFLTICTEEKKNLLCQIVGTGLLDGPQVRLTPYGQIARTQLEFMKDFYPEMCLEKYVIMPNHIHLLLHMLDCGSGPSGRPVPTSTGVGKFVGTFKRFCNRKNGCNIWQSRSYDHVVRGEADYRKIWEYIDDNPRRWTEDRFYQE